MRQSSKSSVAKQTLSVIIKPQLYKWLHQEVEKGKISRFVESLIEERLASQDQKLAQEYQKAAQDKKRWKEASEWELAQIADWNKQDGGEDN